MATPGSGSPQKDPSTGVISTPPVEQRMNADPYAQAGTVYGAMRRPASSPTRLILDFFPEACCGDAEVLKEDDLNQVPPAVAARGVAQDEWSKWMHRFKDEVNGRNLSFCTCCALSCIVIPFPFVCWVFISQQQRAKCFCEAINRELFEPRGMYFKTQKSSVISLMGDCSFTKDNVYWIAVSLTTEDAEKLKADEHLFWGCGPSHWSCKCCNETYKYVCCCGVQPQF